MNISTEFVDTVKKRVKDALDGDDSIELEAVYTGKHADIKRFNNLIKYYRKKNDQFKETRTTTLDISQKNNTRVTIKGNNDITAFCNSRVLPQDVEIIKKKPVENTDLSKVGNDDVCSFKLNMKREERMKKEKYNFDAESKSYFRLKKRISFKAIRDPFQIDMTIVREFEGNVNQVGKIANEDEKREIEIELIQPGSEVQEGQVIKVTNDLISHMYTVLCILQNSSHVVGPKASSEVEKGYKDLIRQLWVGKRKDNKFNTIGAETILEQKHFLSYKPVTLELSHLDEKCAGTPGNIRENYAVTEKADGDRMALFIFDCKVYLVNDRFDGFKYTGIYHKDLKRLNDSLIDGEFIRQGKTERLDLFLGFDIYFHSGEDVRLRQFTGKNNRYELVKDTLDSITKCAPSGCFEFRAKDFKVHKDIFVAIKDVLHFATYECRYHTDGLIFQPTNLGCGDIYVNAQKNHTQNAPPSLSTTWQRVYKWKPPEQNTIDFMIFVPQVSRQVATELTCELRVHNNYNNKNVLKTILDVLNYDASSKYEQIVFVKQVFSVEDLIKHNVKSGEIWEFSFRNDETKQWKDQKNVTRKGSWEIHKRRDDKMGVLLQKNKNKKNTLIDQYELAGSANAVKTANSVYSTIVHPVNEDMIKSGEIPSADMDSQYYVNTIDREKLLMLHMNEFHNKIKEQLITKFSGEKYTKHIVDVACGRGGDIYKYKNNNYASVLGFDISFEGIFSDNDSAWTRYLKFKGTRTRMMFLPQDMGKQLGSFSDPSDEESSDENEKDFQKISKYIMGNTNDIDEKFTRPKIKQELDFFKDRVNEKFDVVNCQFALHYFFKDEGTLTTFCKNVDNLLKVGGHFIGTCFNGVEVNKKFESENKKRIEGEISGNVVWRIDKGYDAFEFQKCGLAIDVFVESIGQSRREYLVDMKYFQQKLKQVNPDIELIEQESFESKFKEKFRVKNEQKEVTMKSQEEALRQYSGMNIWFIFQKKETK